MMECPAAPALAEMRGSARTGQTNRKPTKKNRRDGVDRGTGGPGRATQEAPVATRGGLTRRGAGTHPPIAKPAPYDLQGVSIDDLIDFTPELRAEAVKLVSRYKIGPLFTPPPVSRWEGPRGLIMVPSSTGGANWPGGSLDPETNILYIYSFRQPTVIGMINDPARSDMNFINGQARDPNAPPPAPAAPAAPGAVAGEGGGRSEERR